MNDLEYWKEYFWVALTDSNGIHWTTFQARKDQANAQDTGFIAVGEGFESQEDAESLVKQLNYRCFRIED